MSRTLITRNDVPAYIRDIASRLVLIHDDIDGGVLGYNFKLYGKHKIGYENQLITHAEQLIKWAQRYYAEAKILKFVHWSEQVSVPELTGSKWHRAKAYRQGVRNYVLLTITDPVALRFEKDKYYSGGRVK